MRRRKSGLKRMEQLYFDGVSMAKETTEGKCEFCSQSFDGASMGKHIKKCKDSPYRTAKKDGSGIFLIKIFSPERPYYWMFIEIDSSATFKQLDKFLRKIWLECCGHLSRFILNHREMSFRNMNVPLNSVISSNVQLDYEYDFGSTTYLKLKILGTIEGSIENVNIISRNEPPQWNCYKCGKPATSVCAICQLQERYVFCEKCLPNHKCSDKEWSTDLALPIVNSPRTGECGYTG